MIGRLETVERLEKVERLEAVDRLKKVERLEAIEKLEKIGRLEAVVRPVKMEDQKRSKDRRRKECGFTGRPTRLKVEKAEENGKRPGGTGRVTRTGFCQKKRSYHKGDSIGIRGSLR